MKREKIKYLDKEEKEVIESWDDVDMTNVKEPTSAEQKVFKKAAKNHLKKN